MLPNIIQFFSFGILMTVIDRPPSNTKSFKRPIRSYVRRMGRMTKSQKEAISVGGEQYIAHYIADSKIDLAKLFDVAQPLALEIGFGMGENLIHQAQNNPDRNYIGIDVHEPGLGVCCAQALALGLKNLKLICHDAIEVLQGADDQVLDNVFILFPDPWHKKRHNKRRLIQAKFIDLLSHKIKPQGLLHIMTDWAEYADHIIETLQQSPIFKDVSEQETEFAQKRISSKFERRGLNKGHQIYAGVFQRH